MFPKKRMYIENFQLIQWIWWVLIFCFPISSFFSNASTQAANLENPKWHAWLKENAQSIEHIQSIEGDTYQDLRFFEKVLSNKRIVFLGESSHGAAQFNSSKVRLVKYLHEKLGYQVLAFESGLGELFAVDTQINKLSPTQSMQDSLYPIWQTKEVLPLFDYIKKSSTSNNPLQLAGFDMQPVGSYGDFLEKWFQQIDPKIATQVKYTEGKFAELLHQSNVDLFHIEQKKMIREYQDLYLFTRNHEQQLSNIYPNSPHMLKITQYVLQDRIHSMEKVVPYYVTYNQYLQSGNRTLATKAYDQYNIARDQTMAKHLVWLTEKLYPQQKIIVWAHNLHIRKANTKTHNPNRNPVVNMGQLLPPNIKKQSYVMGIYMNRGISNKNDRTPLPVRFPHPKGSVESILGTTGYKHIFVDLAHAYQLADLDHLHRLFDLVRPNREETSWMFTKRSILDWGAWEEQLILREQYDGILFMDQVTKPAYIE